MISVDCTEPDYTKLIQTSKAFLEILAKQTWILEHSVTD